MRRRSELGRFVAHCPQTARIASAIRLAAGGRARCPQRATACKGRTTSPRASDRKPESFCGQTPMKSNDLDKCGATARCNLSQVPLHFPPHRPSAHPLLPSQFHRRQEIIEQRVQWLPPQRVDLRPRVRVVVALGANSWRTRVKLFSRRASFRFSDTAASARSPTAACDPPDTSPVFTS